MKRNVFLMATLLICLVASNCAREVEPMGLPPEEITGYQNWHLSEGELELASLAIELVGERTVITRRLKHLDPEYDMQSSEKRHADYSPYISVPHLKIVGKADPGVSLSVVVEEFRTSGDRVDAGADGGVSMDADSEESGTPDSVSKVAPSGAILLSQYESLPFELDDSWGEAFVELLALPYEPTVEGYEVHVSIVKKGTGSMTFVSGLVQNKGILKEDLQ